MASTDAVLGVQLQSQELKKLGQDLLKSVCFPIRMHHITDLGTITLLWKQSQDLIDILFCQETSGRCLYSF